MAKAVDLAAWLNDSEIKHRKRWLYFFIATVALGWLVTLATAPTTVDFYRASYAFPWLVFGGSIAFSAVYQIVLFKLAYQNHRTFLLTLTLVLFVCSTISMALSLIALGYMFSTGMIPSGFFTQFLRSLPGVSSQIQILYLIVSIAMAIPYVILTNRLRKVNKVIRCYVKFPKEAADAVAFVREGGEERFSEALKKWPRLKPLIQREKAFSRS